MVRSSAQVCKPGAPWVWSQSITSTLKVTADGLRRVHTGEMELTRWNNNPLKSFHFAASRLPHRERRLPQLLPLTAAVAFCYKWNKNTALSSGGNRPPGRQWKISHFINTNQKNEIAAEWLAGCSLWQCTMTSVASSEVGSLFFICFAIADCFIGWFHFSFVSILRYWLLFVWADLQMPDQKHHKQGLSLSR